MKECDTCRVTDSKKLYMKKDAELNVYILLYLD